MNAPPILLRGATILGTDVAADPAAASMTQTPDMPTQDLLIRDGMIVARGRLPSCADAQEIDAGALLLLPGLVNAHTHSPEALARGRAANEGQRMWLREAYHGGLDTLTPERISHAVTLSARELIRSGTVAVTDHLRQTPPRLDAVRAAADAWAASGMRARIAVMMRDRIDATGRLPGIDGAAATPLPAGALLALAEQMLAEMPQGVALGFGPSAPQRCSDELMVGLARLAREAGSFLHLHLAETAEDAADCLALYGESATAHLQRLRVLGPWTELVHAVHVTADDLARIADCGATLVHSPVANLRLGAGVAPIAAARAAGITVRLGTDGAGSNDSQNMMEVMKMAVLAPRAARPQSQWISPDAALEMATAAAQLVPGTPGDLIGFDRRAPAFSGKVTDWPARVVLAAQPADLALVIAGGRVLQLPPQRQMGLHT